MKAMILAAGRGLRMRPLTDKTPKPLLVVAGHPFIGHQLLTLAAAGIRDVVINVSYRAKQIMQALENGHRYGVNIVYSFEPTALETGGGIFQALPLLGNDPFMVLSADIYTDYPISKLVSHTLDSAQNIKAHLVLIDNPSFHPAGDFHLLPDQFLTLTGTPKLTFANVAICHPTLFQNHTEGWFPLVQVFHKSINERKLTGEHYQNGIWFNVGTVEELRRLEHYLEKKAAYLPR